MKFVSYVQTLAQFTFALGSFRRVNYEANFQPIDEHVEPPFVKSICKSREELKDFMTAADTMIRAECRLVDSSRRAVDKPSETIEEVDFIVVGGGVAGSVVAGRLSENANWTVTLLESGPEAPAATDIPAFMSSAVGTEYDWKYTTVPQKYACWKNKGVCDWPRGKLLGGTASLSGSMYSRGHRAIYDSWAYAGNPGWSYEDLLPVFKMSETNRDYGLGQGSKYHGSRGPMPVQKPREILPITKTLMETGKELGYPEIDMSDPEPMGFSVAQVMMNAANTRVSTPAAYLRPYVRSRKNLKVKINCHVTKLLVDVFRKTVYGVQYVDRTNVTRTLLARKEVVLSAGVIGSPHVLMVSGIGPAEDLEPLGVTVVRNLPVGRNLQHQVAVELDIWLNVTNDRFLSYDSIVRYLRFRDGPLSTTGGLQTSAFIRSHRVVGSMSDVQLFFDGFSAASCADARPAYSCNQPMGPARLNVRPVNLLPLSRGTIRLVSPDPMVRVQINPNYLSVAQDADVLVWSLNFVANMAKMAPLRRLGAQLDTKPAEHCEQYAFGTESYWRCLIRYHTLGENHHAGTCKMGPAMDPTAVVDPQLRVHGVRGIRVADASVMPLQPNCNPIAPIIMIAEKAAQFIKDTWK